MTWLGSLQIIIILGCVLAVSLPLGGYLYRVFAGQHNFFERVYAPCEKIIYKIAGINPSVEMDWKGYIRSLLWVNFIMLLFAFVIFRLQGILPMNPDHMKSLPWDLSFNTAASFVTNTDWQNYGGEMSLSYLSQTLAITFLQFAAAATGLAAAFGFVRGIIARKSKNMGNFWVDFIKAHTRILIPGAIVLAIVFIGLGIPQTFQGAQTVHTLQGTVQTIARGPIASLEAIKELGTNGGGFLNANSAHPFENPSILTNILQIITLLSLPTASLFAFGRFLKNRKQSYVLYAVLAGLLLIGTFVIYWGETAGNPILQKVLGVTGTNMEGKDVRFGLPLSSLFSAATTATSTGAVNMMHDSLTPIGGFIPLLFMMFNVVFGGIGVGLINIIMYLIITVFIAGLMVGRTPEIFGKKIEAREIKLATFSLLVHPILILIPTAIALMTRVGTASILNPGSHGFTEVLYAFTSAAANNGSAFGGLSGNTPFYNIILGVVMLLGRYVTLIAMFAVAGSLAAKPHIPESVGTLKTDTFVFSGVFVVITIIVGALTFFPALAIGPIGEQLQMLSGLLSK